MFQYEFYILCGGEIVVILSGVSYNFDDKLTIKRINSNRCLMKDRVRILSISDIVAGRSGYGEP